VRRREEDGSIEAWLRAAMAGRDGAHSQAHCVALLQGARLRSAVLARRLCLVAILPFACVADPAPPAADTEAGTAAVDDDEDVEDDETAAPDPTDASTDTTAATTIEPETSESSGDGSSSTTGEPEGPRPTPGCGAGDPSLLHGTIDVDGVERTYVLVPPDDYDPDVPYPIVFGFHGAYDSGAGAQLGYRLEQWWEGQAIVVYPDGLPIGGVPRWDYAAGGKDFDFVLALYEAIGRQMCFDQNEAFAFGYSAGGYMANSLGCFRGDLFRGVGAIAGGMPSGTCTGPMAVFAAHGEMDTTVPFSSGIAARDRWITENGCSASTTPADDNGCVSYEDCESGYPLTWCTYEAAHMFFGWTAEAAVTMFRDLPF
jgi:predicted esterase